MDPPINPSSRALWQGNDAGGKRYHLIHAAVWCRHLTWPAASSAWAAWSKASISIPFHVLWDSNGLIRNWMQPIMDRMPQNESHTLDLSFSHPLRHKVWTKRSQGNYLRPPADALMKVWLKTSPLEFRLPLRGPCSLGSSVSKATLSEFQMQPLLISHSGHFVFCGGCSPGSEEQTGICRSLF